MILQTESVISVSKGGNMGNLNETPSANRLHIGIYGKTNSGKSSLINAVTKQEVSIVADVAGTTTDPVYKPMEIHPLGPCVIIDTAGVVEAREVGDCLFYNTAGGGEEGGEYSGGGGVIVNNKTKNK